MSQVGSSFRSWSEVNDFNFVLRIKFFDFKWLSSNVNILKSASSITFQIATLVVYFLWFWSSYQSEMIFFSTSYFWVCQSEKQIALGKPLETIGWIFYWWRSVKHPGSVSQDYIDVINNQSAPKVPRIWREMDVSLNGGLKTPQIIHGLIGVFHYFQPSILGVQYPYFWKHPDGKRNMFFFGFLRTEGHGGSVLLGIGISREFWRSKAFRDLGDSFAGLFLCVYIYIYIYNHDIYVYI